MKGLFEVAIKFGGLGKEWEIDGQMFRSIPMLKNGTKDPLLPNPGGNLAKLPPFIFLLSVTMQKAQITKMLFPKVE